MKFRVFQRFAGIVLLVALLFNQAGVGYLHDVHDAHTTISTDHTKDLLLPHGDHCKICSIDLLINLYFSPLPEFAIAALKEQRHGAMKTVPPSGGTAVTRNKAPPFSTAPARLSFC